MQTLKRSIVVQIVMFTFFFFFGVDYILRELVQRTTLFTVMEFVFFGLVLGGGITWFFLTKKSDVLVVDQKYFNQVKIALYLIAGTLLLSIISDFFSSPKNVQEYLLIISGALMSLVAIYGLYISIKIFLSGDSNSE
ncbi:MAG: hypothetical protein GX149_04510 [Acholeplasmataceae bacterium]|jgi:hypothetical protein|nr:hypothetical protein [Acholeplasmataceae bacterium]